MRLLILSSCTGSKAVSHPRQLLQCDFAQGQAHVKAREMELQDSLRPAGALYTGQHHLRLMAGIKAFRTAQPSAQLDLHILSAGYGIVSELDVIAPYECTFQGKGHRAIREMANTIHVPNSFRSLWSERYDLGMILLGKSYLEACGLDSSTSFAAPTLLLCTESIAEALPDLPNLRKLILTRRDATIFHTGFLALKGEIAQRLLVMAAKDPAILDFMRNPESDILAVVRGSTRTTA